NGNDNDNGSNNCNYNDNGSNNCNGNDNGSNNCNGNDNSKGQRRRQEQATARTEGMRDRIYRFVIANLRGGVVDCLPAGSQLLRRAVPGEGEGNSRDDEPGAEA
ncbi:MAG: hypothetical protein JWP98_90, partial [Edaphobacter sp.]|nr:hypothetical protein [Edaphobacter sp.]